MKNFSESYLKLAPDLKLLDWFTPTNHIELDKRDEDLDSSGATLIPGTHMVVGGGNGRVYLSSFGLENVGTGQFCVYGLLPGANNPKLAAPTGVKAQLLHHNLTLSWNPVPGAREYRVFRTSTIDPKAKPVGLGLTTPMFTEPAPERGELASYTVVAVGVNGVSTISEAVQMTAPKPKHMEH